MNDMRVFCFQQVAEKILMNLVWSNSIVFYGWFCEGHS